MHNFLQWCEDKSNDLGAVLKDVEEIEGDKKLEGRARTGLRGAYPDGYYRSQYPDLYSTPRSATAALDLKNAKGSKGKAAGGNSPL